MKINKQFLDNVKWFLSVRNKFNFDGNDKYYNKLGINLISDNRYNKNKFTEDDIKANYTGVEAFYLYQCNGIIVPTKHPNLLKTLHKVSRSLDLHIKMYGEDRANGILSFRELEELADELKAPEWFINAVEGTKEKAYKESEELSKRFFMYRKKDWNFRDSSNGPYEIIFKIDEDKLINHDNS